MKIRVRGWLVNEVAELKSDQELYKRLNVPYLAHFEGMAPNELDEEIDGAIYSFINAIADIPPNLCTTQDIVYWTELFERYRASVRGSGNPSRGLFAEFLANQLAVISGHLQLYILRQARANH
ncbi:MAG: hypothetical protein AAB585_00240 [Patescibacteria group bacterium]